MKKKYSREDIENVIKKKDAWWTVLVIDHIAIPLTLFVANYIPFLSPNIFTLSSLITSLLAAFYFFKERFLLGAVLYEIAFLFDCIDGKLAKLTKRQSISGLWLDKISDKTRLYFNTIGLSIKCCPLIGITFVFMYLWDEIDAITYENLSLKHKKDKYETINTNSKITNFLLKHRLALLPSAVEMDTLAFFIGPIVSLKWGFILAITLAILRKIVIHSHFKLGNAFKEE